MCLDEFFGGRPRAFDGSDDADDKQGGTAFRTKTRPDFALLSLVNLQHIYTSNQFNCIWIKIINQANETNGTVSSQQKNLEQTISYSAISPGCK